MNLKTFFAVSRCLKSEKKDDGNYLSNFHFKGFLWGEKVCIIKVESGEPFKVKEDYIMELQLLEHKGGVILAKPMRYKKINDLRRKFF